MFYAVLHIFCKLFNTKLLVIIIKFKIKFLTFPNSSSVLIDIGERLDKASPLFVLECGGGRCRDGVILPQLIGTVGT